MAVSKLVLGLNARNFLYIRKFNKARAKRRADNKLLTKESLLGEKIPTAKLLATFTHLGSVRSFDWASLPDTFVLKPSSGYGGEGIILVENWDGEKGMTNGGIPITIEDLEADIFDILDGAHSLGNLPDTAFIEERVIAHRVFSRVCEKGVPDIRVICFNQIPVMAMLRLPTTSSDGKANLHLGALGIGIDIRTGITTQAVQYDDVVNRVPGMKVKTGGIKIPEWKKVLSIASRTQQMSKLGYAGIDIVLDDRHGPLVLEVNARPGLSIQLANGSSLRTRLERISDITVRSTNHAIELAQHLFAESRLADVDAHSNILGVVEKVVIYGGKGKKTVEAKIDTGAYRTSVDESLVHELGLEEGKKSVFIQSGSGSGHRPTVRLSFRLRDVDIDTTATYTDRSHLKYPIIIGRLDLNGFLVDPTKTAPVETD